jgi:hypothetical protein
MRGRRYRLRLEPGRLSTHLHAFQLYYGVRENPCKRAVNNLRRSKQRVRKLMECFEHRLSVALYRLG